jgi:hypothetical protein
MQYTPVQIESYLTKADRTVAKLRQKIDEDIIFRRDPGYKRIPDLIWLIREATEWEKLNNFSDPETHGLAAYLNHKISGYNFDFTAAYYATPTTPTSDQPAAPAASGYQLFKQMVVGQADAPTPNTNTYTNVNLIGRYVQVYLDGIMLNTGLSDRVSYTYDITLGHMVFSADLVADQVLTVFTYIPSLAGWTLFDSFTVPLEGLTTYQSVGLIGKNAIAVVDGLLIPLDLADTLSTSYSALLGEITFSSALSPNQAVSIYTF